jgi:site-specific recombinase XerD
LLPALAPNPPNSLISAHSDTEAVLVWLAEYAQRPATLRSYRKEAERFLLWLNSRQQSLAEVKREDVHDYRRFLAHPHPAEQWIGPAVPRSHPQWRPLTGPLSASSIDHAFTILGGLYSYLNHAGHLNGNPFRLHKAPRQRRTVENGRFFDADCWAHICHTLQTLPADSPRQVAHRERAIWAFSLLYYSGARRSEASAARMGDMHQKRGNWWWRVHGKTGTGDIPVSPPLLAALQRYRLHLGLSPLPASQEDTPLLCRLGDGRGAQQGISDKALYLLIKEILQRAAEQAPDAMRPTLQQASTHWLRHTAATHQLDAGISLLMVSQNLRHGSIQTTRRYLHSEDDARHAAMQNLPAIPAGSTKEQND